MTWNQTLRFVDRLAHSSCEARKRRRIKGRAILRLEALEARIVPDVAKVFLLAQTTSVKEGDTAEISVKLEIERGKTASFSINQYSATVQLVLWPDSATANVDSSSLTPTQVTIAHLGDTQTVSVHTHSDNHYDQDSKRFRVAVQSFVSHSSLVSDQLPQPAQIDVTEADAPNNATSDQG